MSIVDGINALNESKCLKFMFIEKERFILKNILRQEK